MRTSDPKLHSCGGSEVRIIPAASSQCGLLNQSHTRSIGSSVLRFRSSQMRMPQNDANFGIGTLLIAYPLLRLDHSRCHEGRDRSGIFLQSDEIEMDITLPPIEFVGMPSGTLPHYIGRIEKEKVVGGTNLFNR